MKIIITSGDPNGIGIEVMLKALEKIHLLNCTANIEFHIAGNLRVIAEYATLFGFPLNIKNEGIVVSDIFIPVIDSCDYTKPVIGLPTLESGKYASSAIEYAVGGTIGNRFDAVVTMPVSKEALYLAGWKYPGHTEMLADRCGSDSQMMILLTGNIRVALATVHIPISNVPSHISKESIKQKLAILNNCLHYDFGITKPRIAILGLNPHAGENGSIGKEENEIIIPAINQFDKKDCVIEGPFPADGFFAHKSYQNYDGIFAMYHDQGLIPLKMIAGNGGVNMTAGLPIVRTSPAHGTAYNIAGKSIAEPQSSIEAILLAYDIVNNRKSNR